MCYPSGCLGVSGGGVFHRNARDFRWFERWEQQLYRLQGSKSGPVRLWATVLESALQDIFCSRPAAREAWDWVFTEGEDRLGRFESICSELHLEPEDIRRWLKKLWPQGPPR